MKIHIRTFAATAAIVAATLLSVTVLAPATDAAPATRSVAAAPAHATSTTTTYPAPSTSPAVTVSVDPQQPKQYFCDTGYLCVFLYTAPEGWYYINFYYCKRYSLSNFIDPTATGADSEVIDDQSAGTTTTFYGKYGNVLQTMHPSSDEFQSVLLNNGGWNPVYSIQVC